MSDPFNDAWAEAAATAPPQFMVYITLELRHDAFVDEVDGPFAIRAVTGVADPVTLGLEPEAALNGGEMVEFKAVPFTAEQPEFAEGKTPESQVTVDNVAREMIPYLEQAVRMRSDMVCTYREYRSDDLTAPCFGPVSFKMKRVSVTGTKVTGQARIDDLANRKFPNKVYTLNDYPGLAA